MRDDPPIYLGHVYENVVFFLGGGVGGSGPCFKHTHLVYDSISVPRQQQWFVNIRKVETSKNIEGAQHIWAKFY